MTSFTQRLKWRLEAAAYDLISVLTAMVPFSALSGFGGWLLQLIGPMTSKHHIARTNIKIAFPELSETETDKLLKAQWENCGRTFAEFIALHRLKAFAPKSRITVEGREKLAAHNPAICISGHFANWEVMAMVMTQAGLPVQVTYRKINNPYIDARVRQKREAYGTRLLVQKSGLKGAKQLIDAIKADESVAILNDQKFNEGISLPFFGEPAMTATGAARLATKTGRPLLPLSVTRQGANFHVIVHDPIDLDITGDRTEDTRNGVIKINQFLEKIIRDNPAQWFWVHRRWPKPLYKADN